MAPTRSTWLSSESSRSPNITTAGRLAEEAANMATLAQQSTPPVSAPRLATAWWMVAVLFTIYLFSWIDRLVVSMLVEPVKQALHLSDFQMSLILGPSFAIVYA